MAAVPLFSIAPSVPSMPYTSYSVTCWRGYRQGLQSQAAATLQKGDAQCRQQVTAPFLPPQTTAAQCRRLTMLQRAEVASDPASR